jgi:hypothetical protein
MPSKQALMAGSLPSLAANELGSDASSTATAAGTTQATATQLTSNLVNVTTSSVNAGVIVSDMNGRNMIYNAGPNTLTVYPQSGGTIIGLAKNAGFTLAALTSVLLEGDGVNLMAIAGI